MAIKCFSCGIEAEQPESFIKTRRSFRTTEVHYCAPCYSQKQVKTHRFTLWIVVGYGLFGALLAWLAPQQKIGWAFLNIFLFQVFSIAVILPHELGHAFVARWLGFRVFRILVGMGKPVWSGKVFGFDTDIAPVPLGGFAFVAPRETEGYRRKMFAIVLAGPIVNLLLLILILPAVDSSQLWKISGIEHGIALALTFFYANFVTLVYSLLPYSFTHPLGRFGTDGKLILSLPFLKAQEIADRHAAYFATEAGEHYNKGNLELAHQWFERGLSLYPNNTNLLIGQGLQFLNEGNFRRARESFLPLMEQPAAPQAFRAVIMNNIAYTDILLDDPGLLEEADCFSREALVTLSTMAAVKGTRGIVLTALGRADEALPFLQQAFQENDNPMNKAETACWLAIAEARRGRKDEAAKHLAQARQLYPTTHSMARAERENLPPSANGGG